MATIEFKGITEYQDMLEDLYLRSDGIIKPAVYDGAAVVIEEVKKQLRKVVSDKATGDLERSTGLSEMENDAGYIHTKLGFEGYDRDHHPNVLKARALEYGTSKQRKKPFIRPAVNACKERAEIVMGETVEKQIKKIMDERG